MRLENLADLFDKTPESTPMFQLQAYVLDLFQANNGGSLPSQVEIVERSLSNN